MENKIYQKAFNVGYLIEKYLPALSQMLAKSLNNASSTFSEGFLAGSNQYITEKKEKDMMISLFKEHGSTSPIKDLNEPDKEEPDIER